MKKKLPTLNTLVANVVEEVVGEEVVETSTGDHEDPSNKVSCSVQDCTLGLGLGNFISIRDNPIHFSCSFHNILSLGANFRKKA